MRVSFHFYLLLSYIVHFTIAWSIDTSFLDWIWRSNDDNGNDIGTNSPLIFVPFEAKTDDEKFLEEAIKLKEIIKSSPLDSCQHKLVLKIKTSCSAMTEEDLAKLSVNLLNCQSDVVGRQTIPCTDSMTLKQCTEKMDGTMWNAYHMMNNRARAVCLLARRAQFQALTEMTVNKLTSTTRNQIAKQNKMMENQDRLERLTLGTINLIEKGNIEILQQQDAVRTSQKGVHDIISHNLYELVKEKALIAAGHKELLRMIQNIKERTDEANNQLLRQSEERVTQHKQLLADIEDVGELTNKIFQKIDISTDKLLQQHAEAASKYQDVIENLVRINETVHYLLKFINVTRAEIDEKFMWMQNFLDKTGIQINKISCIACHVAYLLIGMLFASFLNFSTLSRVILTLVVPLNLFLTYFELNDLVLGYDEMTIGLITSLLSIAIINKFLRSSQSLPPVERRSDDNKTSSEPQKKTSGISKKFSNFRQFFSKLISSMNDYMPSASNWVSSSRVSEKENSYIENYSNGSVAGNIRENYPLLTPSFRTTRKMSSHNLVRCWLENKVPTQSSSSGSDNSQRMCSAICRWSGKRCRNVSSRGSDYCYRHIRRQSEIS